jgi:hypothetical protein
MSMTDPDHLQSVYEPLAASVRNLIDVTIRTEAGPATVLAARQWIDAAGQELSIALMPGSFGLRTTQDGQGSAWGNAAIGIRNPAAPPLVLHREADGLVWTEFVLGAGYEGPAGHVHGGVCALVLDHVLGATAHVPGRPRLHRHVDRAVPTGHGVGYAARPGTRATHRRSQNLCQGRNYRFPRSHGAALLTSRKRYGPSCPPARPTRGIPSR